MGVWSGWSICGRNLFDSLDFVTANIMLPVGALLTCLFVGWRRLDREVLHAQMTNNGRSPSGSTGSSSCCSATSARPSCCLVFLDNLGVF